MANRVTIEWLFVNATAKTISVISTVSNKDVSNGATVGPAPSNANNVRLTATDSDTLFSIGVGPSATVGENRGVVPAGTDVTMRIRPEQTIFLLAKSNVQDPNAVNVGGYSKVWQPADATLTRPNNATAYAAHVGIGSAASCLFKFSNFFRKPGGTGILSGLRLTASVASIAAANMGAVRAHLYNASPATPPAADQAVFTTLIANAAIKLGIVDFSTWNIGGTGSTVIESYGTPVISPLPIVADPSAADLYMVLEANGAFTPIASAIINGFASGVFD